MQTYVVFNDIADEHWSQKSRKIGKHICDMCQKTFTTKGALNVHITCVHNKELNFKCPQCGMQFGTKNYMSRHFKNIHG